ncbi:unnamed protein product [Polarella glacialis]|uniref:Uncharacterized protein n=1 Tax=Polarella glacialis TaxID=89957 RepID=A0A813JNC1_POLGL|nr:unnamed protein product [Polarella glacialis]
MVIPMGGMGGGAAMQGPPPPEVAPRFKVIKYCVLTMMASTCGQLLAGGLLGELGGALSNALNLILNTVFGIWLLKDDPLIGKTYNFLTTTCCMWCGENCQGGMSCLLPFVACNLITVVMNILLNGVIQQVIAQAKGLLGEETIYEAFVLWLLLVSTAGALLAQIIGSFYGYKAYTEIRDGGYSSSGGDWAQASAPPGGGERESQPAAGFSAFQGSGNRLGS